jgi:hypothetical protein
VLNIAPFANKAQHAWQERLKQADAAKILYNGIKLDP